MLIDTGARLSEVAGLRYDLHDGKNNDVDLDQGILRVMGKGQIDEGFDLAGIYPVQGHADGEDEILFPFQFPQPAEIAHDGFPVGVAPADPQFFEAFGRRRSPAARCS